MEAIYSGLVRSGFFNRIGHRVPIGCYDDKGINHPLGLVDERGTKYRFGEAYVGYKGLRLGIESELIVYYIQAIFAHYFLSPQPSFELLSKDITPIIHYKTRSNITSY